MCFWIGSLAKGIAISTDMVGVLRVMGESVSIFLDHKKKSFFAFFLLFFLIFVLVCGFF